MWLSIIAVQGSNRWGQDGTFSCSSKQPAHSTPCDETLFCLPHPYGCSCTSGFQGIDCDQRKRKSYLKQKVIFFLLEIICNYFITALL